MRICTCCLSGCFVHASRRFSVSLSPITEAGRKMRRTNFTNRQTMRNVWNSNCSSFNCFDINLLTRTKLSAGFLATLKRTSNLFEGRLNSRILQFLQTHVLSLSYSLIARNGSVILLSLCHMFVVQSLAFSFRLSEVWSSI